MRGVSDDSTSAVSAVPPSGDLWCGLVDGPLPLAEVHRFLRRADCGAVVVFCGTVRDHSPGRPGVDELTYEVYREQAQPRLAAVGEEVHRRWPATKPVVLLHRVGPVPVGEDAVVVGVAAPHRAEAFAAARFGIDAVKASVPVWKRERWVGGESWGLEAQHLVDAAAVASPDTVGPGGGGGRR